MKLYLHDVSNLYRQGRRQSLQLLSLLKQLALYITIARIVEAMHLLWPISKYPYVRRDVVERKYVYQDYLK